MVLATNGEGVSIADFWKVPARAILFYLLAWDHHAGGSPIKRIELLSSVLFESDPTIPVVFSLIASAERNGDLLHWCVEL